MRIVLGALAEGPLQPSALEQLAGVAHSTLYARLASLIRVQMIAKRQLSEFPPRVEYRVTDIGRVLYARALLMDREQKRILAAESPEADERLPALLRALAPVARVPAGTDGVCMLAEESSAPSPLVAWLSAGDGSLEALASQPAGPAMASASGDGEAWDRLLLAGETSRLQIGGDQALARAVLGALTAAVSPRSFCASDTEQARGSTKPIPRSRLRRGLKI